MLRAREEMHHAVVGSAFPPDMTGTLLVLRAYFDESGTNPGSRLVTMVGVLATPKRWRLLSRAWWAVLERHGVKGEFKADECVRGLAPPYNGWSPRERLAFRARLGSLIDEHAVYASVVSMLRADFDTEVRPIAIKGSLWSDPYPWVMRSCLEFIAKTPKRRGQRVACVADEGHGYQARFFDYYPKLRRAQKWENVFISLTSAPSDKWAPLQVAEWLVYECRHDTDQYVYGTHKKHPGLMQCFKRMEVEGGYFKAEKLRAFIHELQEAMGRDHRETWELWRVLLEEESRA